MKTYLIAALLGIIVIASSCNDGDSNPMLSTGKGGSMARFAITDTHVYTVDANNLYIYEIAESGAIEKVNQVELDGGVETIFAQKDKLYFGTSSSMITYDISDPANPKFDSQYTHFTACDPVVVQDTIAYITIRTSNCRTSGQNVLEILNIKDPANPYTLSVTEVNGPYGLGVDGNTLFVCEGEDGFMMFDVTDPGNPQVKGRITDCHTYDLIPNNGLLTVTGNDGVMQYSYEDFKIDLLSKIRVEK